MALDLTAEYDLVVTTAMIIGHFRGLFPMEEFQLLPFHFPTNMYKVAQP